MRLTEPELRVWQAFLGAQHQVLTILDKELQREHGISLAYYEVLLFLSRAPERRLRMAELARTVLLSPSGLTRLVDRMVADGTVERLPCASDARAAYAHLTDAGYQKLREAARTHVRGIREHFLDRVSEPEREGFRCALERLAV
ncbi:MAG TPA: MarR family transcriptional regulator [Candidatus Dormibacteraeota bacterium]